MTTQTKTTCDYCDKPGLYPQARGTILTCEQHVMRPHQDKIKIKTVFQSCMDCGAEMDHWWEDEEGDPYCSECYTENGKTCDGCVHEDCVQCNEEEHECDEEDCADCRRGIYCDCADSKCPSCGRR
jgi:hypothetical protein